MSKTMYLIINTAKKDIIEVLLAKDAEKFRIISEEAKFKQAELLLPTIVKLLGLAKVKPTAIKGIGVVNDPGSFTSLRIGVVTANTLAYAWKVPVVGIKLTKYKTESELVKKVIKNLEKTADKKFNLAKNIVLPFYGAEPNITKK